jgi:hypothetical protein
MRRRSTATCPSPTSGGAPTRPRRSTPGAGPLRRQPRRRRPPASSAGRRAAAPALRRARGWMGLSRPPCILPPALLRALLRMPAPHLPPGSPTPSPGPSWPLPTCGPDDAGPHEAAPTTAPAHASLPGRRPPCSPPARTASPAPQPLGNCRGRPPLPLRGAPCLLAVGSRQAARRSSADPARDPGSRRGRGGRLHCCRLPPSAQGGLLSAARVTRVHVHTWDQARARE